MTAYRLIQAEKAVTAFPVSRACELLEVSRSGFNEQRSACLVFGSPMTSSNAGPGPAKPNQLWFTGITYLRTREGWLYLAAVQDAYSRRIVGWQMAENMRHELVVAAFQMAVSRRRPDPGLIHHSDQGSQFVARGVGPQQLATAERSAKLRTAEGSRA